MQVVAMILGAIVSILAQGALGIPVPFNWLLGGLIATLLVPILNGFSGQSEPPR